MSYQNLILLLNIKKRLLNEKLEKVDYKNIRRTVTRFKNSPIDYQQLEVHLLCIYIIEEIETFIDFVL